MRQLGAKLILKEIQLRAAAGQHQLARNLLSQFPAEGVAGETLQQVRELLDKYAAEDARRKAVLDELNAQVAKIADDNGRRLAEGFVKEIAAEVNDDAIARLASFERLVDDAALTPEQKVALAISGWLVGSNQATDNFQTAVSLAHARDMILRIPARAAGAESREAGCRLARYGRRVDRAHRPNAEAHEAAADGDEAERARAADARTESRRAARRGRRAVPRAASARVRSAAPLPDDRDAGRRRRHAGANDRFLGRPGGQG